MTDGTDLGYNVLLIVSDQHRRDAAGCYGNRIAQTPNLDALAGQGVRFDQAYCQEPICGPSRASLLTGTYPHTCNAFSHRPKSVLKEMPTMGSVFREAGYATGAIGKVHVLGEDRTKRDLGFGERALRYYTYQLKDYEELVGKENVDRYASHHANSTHRNRGKYNPGNDPSTLDESLMYDNIVTDKAIAFMERNRQQPFFLWMGLEKPHPQWYAPERFHALYDPRAMPLPTACLREHAGPLPKRYAYRSGHGQSAQLIRSYTEEERKHCVAAYYANVSYMDMNIGRALAALDRLDLARRTIVIYTSDHGEMLMDHSLFQKHCMFEGAVAVPLIMRAPGAIPADRAKRSIVGLIDLFPTLLDMTGLSAPKGLEGVSMAKLACGADEDERRTAFSEYYPSDGTPERMMRSGPWKYIYAQGDREQLYNRETDPDEMENLAENPEQRERCATFRAQTLDGWDVATFDFDPE